MLAVGAVEEVEIQIGDTCPCRRLSTGQIHPKGNHGQALTTCDWKPSVPLALTSKLNFLVSIALRVPCIGELCLAHSALACKMFLMRFNTYRQDSVAPNSF